MSLGESACVRVNKVCECVSGGEFMCESMCAQGACEIENLYCSVCEGVSVGRLHVTGSVGGE